MKIIAILQTSFFIVFLILSASISKAQMTTEFDANGQVILAENGKSILRYNYEIVYENDEYAFNGLDANEYVKTETDTFMANPSIYAVPRSNYIHPVFGLNGEILTRDWSKDHPHHRGIYWAWPEVDYGKDRTDLHALQKIFARPTGRITLLSGADFAQVEAENLWIIEEGIVPIAREIALIRAYPKSGDYQLVDLVYKFEGLKDSVTIARRGTNAYGGLNIRMMTPEPQKLTYHMDKSGKNPQRGWSDLSGIFSGNDTPTGLSVFQHQSNPEYPGEWVEYPELSWVQPTFPTTGTRFPLKQGDPLTLRFRIIIHKGGKPDKKMMEQLWDEYHSEQLPEFDLGW